MNTFETQIVPHVLGFIRGALRFGGCPQSLRAAVAHEFPRLNAAQVDELLAAGQARFTRQLN